MAPTRKPPEKIVTWQTAWPFIRDIVLFVAGLFGVFYELFTGVVNPSLLILFAAMMGLPLALQHKNGKT